MPQQPENLTLPTIENNPVEDSRDVSDKAVIAFTGGENAALERLNHFLWEGNSLESYKETRNKLLGSDYSSKLSPWLANGCLSARHVYNEVRKFETIRLQNDSTRWMICQLLWRDFYQFAAYKHGSDMCLGGMRALGYSKDKISITGSEEILKWCHGKTGQRFVDANMIELFETGYMGSRGRKAVALYLIRYQGLDWRLGASWFEHFLLDFEPCNNYGNWNFKAGVGHDIKKYNNFNIEKEAREYDPEGHYQDYWLGSSV